MKQNAFKRQIILLMLLLAATQANAQEGSLKFHSATFGIGVLETSSESAEGGFNYVADVSTSWREHLFSFYVNSGSGFFVGTWGDDASEAYLGTSVTYGREIKLLNWIKLEGHAGLGLFNHKYTSEKIHPDINETSIGFPVRAKLIFFYKFIGLGINQNANFNSLVTIYSTDFVLQITF